MTPKQILDHFDRVDKQMTYNSKSRQGALYGKKNTFPYEFNSQYNNETIAQVAKKDPKYVIWTWENQKTALHPAKKKFIRENYDRLVTLANYLEGNMSEIMIPHENVNMIEHRDGSSTISIKDLKPFYYKSIDARAKAILDTTSQIKRLVIEFDEELEDFDDDE